jgi:hypothetical protein
MKEVGHEDYEILTELFYEGFFDKTGINPVLEGLIDYILSIPGAYI